LFHSILQKNLGLSTNDKAYRQAFLVLTTLSILVFVLLFYIVYNLFVTQLYLIITLELISLCFAALTWYILIKKHNIPLASTILILTIFFLTLLFIFDQKHHDYALAQAVMLPVLSIYLKGLKQGTLYSVLYIAAVLTIAFFGIDKWEPVPFTATSFTNLTFTYLVVILLVYYFEFSRVEAFDIIQKSHQELQEYKENLEQKVEEALQEKRQQEAILIQQSKMAVMGEMIASIAHQWRQPLSTTSAIIQTAKIDNELSRTHHTKIDEALDKILTQVEFMDQTITDFSSFFKPKKEKEFFSLSSSVDNVLNILQPQFNKYGISVVNNLTDKNFMIDGYRNEFSQVLLNILTNAKDAICKKMEKKMISKGEGTIKIEVGIEANKIGLSICDNGGGIQKEILEHIFDPYVTTKEDDTGTGIGLYMSKMIMQTYMNGDISAYNSSDGACIYLHLKGVQRLV